VPLFFECLIALFITTACMPMLLKWAPLAGLTDNPGVRKVHHTPVPRVGGIAMAVGILTATLVAVPWSRPLAGLVSGIAVLLVFGVWDDRVDLNYKFKFLGQFLAVALCMGIGDVRIESITLDGRIQIPEPLSSLVTFVFLVGVTNAINLADGLDGLAGGLALLCLCAIAVLGTIAGNEAVTQVALIEGGAILGFLRFNTHPARVFMGDGGSQMLGFSIGALAILATQGETSAVSATVPLLLLGLPILDTMTVMLRRILSGRSPFSSDRNHLHHRLLDLGFAHHEAVMCIYCLQVGFFLLAYFLRFDSDLVILAAFLAFSCALLAVLQWASSRQWRVHTGQAFPLVSMLVARVRKPESSHGIERGAAWIMGAGLVAYAALAIVASTHVGGDVSLLSGAMLALVVALSRSPKAGGLTSLERLAAYIGVILLVYLDQSASSHGPMLTFATWIVIGATAAAAVARFLFSATRRFEVSALDVLIALVALAIPKLPGLVALPPDLPNGILKAIVLLYVVESLDGIEVQQRVPRTILAVTFGAVLLRGLVPLGV
jgi:UDP-GlcNAc:undecaprenyl-phosphate/decaprenyl-phosphate GlcNAc-1-phosphate transferase